VHELEQIAGRARFASPEKRGQPLGPVRQIRSDPLLTMVGHMGH
jgi:hypothetical protein